MWEGEAAGHYPDDGDPNTTLCRRHARPQRMQNHLRITTHRSKSVQMHTLQININHQSVPREVERKIRVCFFTSVAPTSRKQRSIAV